MKIKPRMALALTVLVVSCATTNPFTQEKPYIASAGAKEGDYLFTTTEDVASDIGIKVPKDVEITRVSGILNYETKRFYGAIEGTFKKSLAQTALRLSGSFKSVKDGKNSYFVSDDNSIELIVAANGLILFASSDILDVYEKTYSNRVLTLSQEVSDVLVSSDAAFYVNNPKSMPDIGIDLSSEAIDRFDYVMSTANDGIYDVSFGMKSEEFAHSLLKIIRAAVIAQIRSSGQKPDISSLKNIIKEEGNVVYITDIKYEGTFLGNIVYTDR